MVFLRRNVTFAVDMHRSIDQRLDIAGPICIHNDKASYDICRSPRERIDCFQAGTRPKNPPKLRTGPNVDLDTARQVRGATVCDSHQIMTCFAR
jgi:hypothetical protein